MWAKTPSFTHCFISNINTNNKSVKKKANNVSINFSDPLNCLKNSNKDTGHTLRIIALNQIYSYQTPTLKTAIFCPNVK